MKLDWIRPVDPSVDYEFNEDEGVWELPCESGEGCFGDDVEPATWMIGGPSLRAVPIALCPDHAIQYCRRHHVKIPEALRDWFDEDLEL